MDTYCPDTLTLEATADGGSGEYVATLARTERRRRKQLPHSAEWQPPHDRRYPATILLQTSKRSLCAIGVPCALHNALTKATRAWTRGQATTVSTARARVTREMALEAIRQTRDEDHGLVLPVWTPLLTAVMPPAKLSSAGVITIDLPASVYRHEGGRDVAVRLDVTWEVAWWYFWHGVVVGV